MLQRGRFDWDTYLRECSARAAPACAFRQAVDIPRNTFQVGMKVEARDPRNSTGMCIATLVDILGPRIALRMDGTDNRNDFWRLVDSSEISPIGTTPSISDEKGKHRPGMLLQPPFAFMKRESDWVRMLQETLRNRDIHAPTSCFKKQPPSPSRNHFVAGMKLEAVDRKNARLICVATIGEVRNDQVVIRFDGWRGAADYTTRYDSRDLFPVGWCERAGHPLEAPGPGYLGSAFQVFETISISPKRRALPQISTTPKKSTSVSASKRQKISAVAEHSEQLDVRNSREDKSKLSTVRQAHSKVPTAKSSTTEDVSKSQTEKNRKKPERPAEVTVQASRKAEPHEHVKTKTKSQSKCSPEVTGREASEQKLQRSPITTKTVLRNFEPRHLKRKIQTKSSQNVDIAQTMSPKTQSAVETEPVTESSSENSQKHALPAVIEAAAVESNRSTPCCVRADIESKAETETEVEAEASASCSYQGESHFEANSDAHTSSVASLDAQVPTKVEQSTPTPAISPNVAPVGPTRRLNSVSFSIDALLKRPDRESTPTPTPIWYPSAHAANFIMPPVFVTPPHVFNPPHLPNLHPFLSSMTSPWLSPDDANANRPSLSCGECMRLLGTPLTAWAVADVTHYLWHSNASCYLRLPDIDVFLRQEIDGEALALLDDELLVRYLGMQPGSAVAMMRLINDLKAKLKRLSSPSSPMPIAADAFSQRKPI